ncbi:helix-turn-helix domain-containing protein [Pseudonocardia sp. GCM10023141]|uniref:helix-turn-helix domain-containing protein n=1 Tax=Pseudonocardia sp. GCM10023141 TaxID=3252653 RepID=UPI003622652B
MAGAELSEYVPGRPHPALSRHVVRYGGYREYSAVPLCRRQVPTGTCTLILGFGPVLRMHGPAGSSTAASFLAGMHDAAVVTEFCGGQHGLQVDLTPLGVYELLGRPMPELTNVTPLVDELDIPELATLPERLAADPGWPQRFARVDAVLRRRLDAARRQPDPEVRWAWHRLVRTGGAVGVQQLAEETGWSRRHLLTRFRSQVGLAPKPAARVLRLQRAATMLVPTMADGGPGTAVRLPLADVAASCGYADHAHLVREFRALAGCTPTQYLAGWG